MNLLFKLILCLKLINIKSNFLIYFILPNNLITKEGLYIIVADIIEAEATVVVSYINSIDSLFKILSVSGPHI